MSTRLNICSKLAALIPAIALVATFSFGFAPVAVAQEEGVDGEMPAMESMAPGGEDAGMMGTEDTGMMMGGEEAAAVDPMAILEGDTAVDADFNPYGIEAIIEHGDFVILGVLAVLVIMSVGSWYIMVLRLIDTQILARQANAAQKNFWTAGSLKEGLTKLEPNSAFRTIVDDGLKAAEHHEGKLTDSVDLNEWVTMSLQRSTDVVNHKLQGGLAFLASVGSTAPFVGLFGTVWGILNALIAIGVSGQVSIDVVAGPLGEALIMTAIGLFVAVPAVLAYNFFVRRNKVLLERVRNFAADIHAVLLSSNQGRQAAE
jgi:biopolymer transport protein ExbB